MLELGFSVLRIAVLAYAGACLLIFLRQSHYVYYPDRVVEMTPADAGMEFEDLRLKTTDGETLAAWYIPAKTQPALTLLDCHGNAGDIGDRVESVRTFHNLGFNVLIFDYRGYGKSTGKPSEAGTYRDADTAWNYLTQTRKVPANQIVVFGRSLGGAIAAWLAAEVHPGVLVVESSFTSAVDMGRQMFPHLPIRWLSRFRYDARSHIARVRCPVLVAHSVEDDMIPFRHGQRLYEAASDPKLFVEMRGGHNAGGLDIDPDYQRRFREFIDKHMTVAERN